MAEQIKHSGQPKHKEFYWSFARYRRNHEKGDIQEMTAIMLEFPYTSRAVLMQALDECPYVHYIIHAQDEINTKRPEERLLVAFPVQTPITEPTVYTRCASIIQDDLGLRQHSTGDYSSTFLFAPFVGYCSTPKVILNDQDREFLDADALYEANRGRWTNAASLQVGAEPPKLDPTTHHDSGLFIFA
ncbi:hypothetical protein [Novosphingobium guangzhouense]|nr:hypothetical protein [Novosphingobium guangzhouense]